MATAELANKTPIDAAGKPFDPSAVESMLILDPDTVEALYRQRVEVGADRYDEVWEGVYIMPPIANDDHQDLVGGFVMVFRLCLDSHGLGKTRGGVNVSDRRQNWESNFRIPDVAVFLNDTNATNYNTFWHGGPNLAVEIVSKGDRCREKLPFYAKVNTGEVLIIDRDPWRLDLYRLTGDAMVSVGAAEPGGDVELVSEQLPFAFKLLPAEGGGRPMVGVRHTGGTGEWRV